MPDESGRGELMAMNYREAELEPRHCAMLDFAAKLTGRCHEIGEADRPKLRDAGFFNMTNRMAR